MRNFNQNNIQKTIMVSMSIILIFFYGLSFGQSPSTIWLHSIPSNIGYSQSSNYHVLKDSEGFVWISSEGGLNRFDGQKVKLYEPDNNDSTSLYEAMVYGKLFEDDKKNLWFSTPSVIHQYHREQDKFSYYFLKSSSTDSLKGDSTDSLKNDYYTFAYEDQRYLWVQTTDGIYQYDTDTHTDKFIAKSVFYYVRKGKYKNGLLQIFSFGGGDKGVQIIETENGVINNDSIFFKKDHIQDIFYYDDTTIWLSSKEKGIIKWNPITDERKYFDDFKGLKCLINQLDENHLIIGVENEGIYLYQIKDEFFWKISTQFISETKSKDFGKIYVDSNKDIWISDVMNGVYFGNFQKNKFKSIPKFPTQLENTQYSFSTIQEDDYGNIWLATENAGLFKYNSFNKKVDNFIFDKNNKNSLPSNLIWDILCDSKNRIWALTHDGAALYRNGKNFSIYKTEDPKRNFFTKIIQLKDEGDILLTSINGEIFKIEEGGGNPKLVSIFKLEEEGECYSLFQDSKNNIYVFFDKGLFVFKYLNGKLLLIEELPFKGYANCYWEDQFNEVLWIGTSNGLMKISQKSTNKKVEFVNLENKLPSKSIKSLLSRNQNILWVGTSNGLAQLNIETQEVQSFSLADGVQSMEFHNNASLNRKNGELWFGGFDGITIVPTTKLDSIKIIPQLKITNIKINDQAGKDLKAKISETKNISEIQHLSRSFNDNTISLEFAALEYSDPSSNQLEYQLEGFDKKPVLLPKGEYGFARYPNLPAGTYNFKVRGANSDGIWSPRQELLKIKIRPPFYQTWWFYLICLILIVAASYAFYRYRVNLVREKARLNTRIAENKMAALRAQMNPHFIYNSMQTVNGIISRKDTIGAVKYINKFSRLMRLILENSRKGKISLDKEIELLTSYMEIEKRRFSNPFTYSITVDEEIDTFETEIPSMLTQPFVENSIKHGLFHKKEQGHIDLKFIRENGSFKCIIEDNGVGRAKSKELNSQTGRTHQSRGLEIVDDRLAIIRQSHPGNYKVKISDLFDLEHQPSGTRVEITLPFE